MELDQDRPPPLEALQRCLDDLDVLIAKRSVVLLGEVPGTNELPHLIELIVGRALLIGLDVVVGLEIPMTEDLEDIGPFFRRSPQYQDGRSTTAVVELLGHLSARKTHLAKGDEQRLEVVAMDGPWVAPGSPVPLDMLGVLEQPRDEVMASNVLSVMDTMPKAFALLVAGPMHTRVDQAPASTLGRLIRAWHPEAIALRVSPAGGRAWILTEEGAGAALELPTVDAPTGALWAPSPGADGHHGVLSPGVVTASAPLPS